MMYFFLILLLAVLNIVYDTKNLNASHFNDYYSRAAVYTTTRTAPFDSIDDETADKSNPEQPIAEETKIVPATEPNDPPVPAPEEISITKTEENTTLLESNETSIAAFKRLDKADDPPVSAPEEIAITKTEANTTLLESNETSIRTFKRFDKVVIVTKIHGPTQWRLLEQSLCLLHYAYNHKVLYDIVAFTALDVPQEEVEAFEKVIAPAKFSLVKDNIGFQQEIAALTPKQRELFLKRCNVTNPLELTREWWHECPGRLAYNWQAEFRSLRIWTHPALEQYRYMFWLDSDGFASEPFEKDPIEYFIEQEAVIMFEHFPKGDDKGKHTRAIVEGFGATACDLRLGKNGHLERNLITAEELGILEAGNPGKNVTCKNTRIHMIHGFGHITDMDFYRQPKVLNGLKRLFRDCYLCRDPDDQLAVTIPAAIYAPEKALDMRSHGFNLRIMHNYVFDGHKRDIVPKPRKFYSYWDAGGKDKLPAAQGVCRTTEGGRR